MVDYSAPSVQVLPFENLPSTDTPLTAEWLNHVAAVLAAAFTATTGRVPVLEANASAEGIRDTIGAALVAGAGITVTVDDPNNTITIAATGSDEQIRDVIGTALVAGTGITVSVNDGADTITVASTVTAYTDEQARDAVGAALTAGSGIGISVNDGADSITITANEPYNFTAADHAFVGWSFDPKDANTSTALSAAGVMHMIKVKLPVAATIASIVTRVNTAGTGLSNCFAALYNSSGTRVAVTADQSTAWQSTGEKTMALTSPYAAAAGTYYIGLLVGAQTTGPEFPRAGASIVANVGLTAAGGFRFSTSGSGQTAAPSSVTLSSNTGNTSATATGYWCALKT